MASVARIPSGVAAIERIILPMRAASIGKIPTRIPTREQTFYALEFTDAHVAGRTLSGRSGAHRHGGKAPAATADENGTEPREGEIHFHGISEEDRKTSIKNDEKIIKNDAKIMTNS